MSVIIRYWKMTSFMTLDVVTSFLRLKDVTNKRIRKIYSYDIHLKHDKWMSIKGNKYIVCFIAIYSCIVVVLYHFRENLHISVYRFTYIKNGCPYTGNSTSFESSDINRRPAATSATSNTSRCRSSSESKNTFVAEIERFACRE